MNDEVKTILDDFKITLDNKVEENAIRVIEDPDRPGYVTMKPVTISFDMPPIAMPDEQPATWTVRTDAGDRLRAVGISYPVRFFTSMVEYEVDSPLDPTTYEQYLTGRLEAVHTLIWRLDEIEGYQPEHRIWVRPSLDLERANHAIWHEARHAWQNEHVEGFRDAYRQESRVSGYRGNRFEADAEENAPIYRWHYGDLLVPLSD